MTIDRRKFEWNLNTVISAITLFVMVAGWVYYWANTVRDIEELKEWRGAHEKTVETRLAESREQRGQTEARVRAAETKAIEMERRVDQTVYRVTVLETSLSTQQEQQQKLTEVLSDLQGDMKVVRELVQRMDAANKRRVP